MKNILIFGASQGIGKACAESLASQDHRLFLFARSEDKLKTLSENLEAKGPSFPVPLDLQDQEKLKTSVSSIVKEYGPVHTLIANTGGPKPGPILEAEPEAFLDAFKDHLLVNLLLAKLVAPGMKEQKCGRIINIISTSVKSPIPNLGVSNTVRGAVASFTKTLSFELGPYGITVNNVLPGYTETARLQELLSGMAAKKGVTEEALYAYLKESIPARRFAQPEEIADVVGFLASEKASYINGVNLPVDGGRTNVL